MAPGMVCPADTKYEYKELYPIKIMYLKCAPTDKLSPSRFTMFSSSFFVMSPFLLFRILFAKA